MSVGVPPSGLALLEFLVGFSLFLGLLTFPECFLYSVPALHALAFFDSVCTSRHCLLCCMEPVFCQTFLYCRFGDKFCHHSQCPIHVEA